MTTLTRTVSPLAIIAVLAIGVLASLGSGSGDAGAPEAPMIEVHYLEIVTSETDATRELWAETHGIEFGEPIPMLGNARTADLRGGGRVAIRAPLRDSEEPVVRPYVLVDDIDAAVQAAEAAGAVIAIAPTEIPGEGTFAIYLLGGIDHGLWQR